MMRGLAWDLNRRGWAAWNVEYRRVGWGQGGGWPQTYEDIAAGIDHLAEVDGLLDLSRVVAIGYSAGGPLALWTAARSDPKVRIARVVSQAGVCSMTDAARTDPDSIVRRFLGGGPDEMPDVYRRADPVELVPLRVDTLLVHGEIDETVPIKRSRQYADAARAAGDEVELVEPPDADHRAHIDPRSEAWRAVVAWLER
jgi:dipeptidyl aminopeptidase/acylaminoacyl peptidase